jgi:hypothetical protein
MVNLQFSTKLLAIPFFDVIYKGRVALRRAELNSEHCTYINKTLGNSMPYNAKFFNGTGRIMNNMGAIFREFRYPYSLYVQYNYKTT